MNKNIILLFIIFCIFILIGASNYDSYNVTMYKNNPQRTGFFDTEGVPNFHNVISKNEITKIGNFTPLVFQNILYFSDIHHVFYAFNLESKNYIWKNIGDNAIISGDKIFITNKNTVNAYNKLSGQLIWNLKLTTTTYFFNLIDNNYLFVISSNNENDEPEMYLNIINKENGQLIKSIYDYSFGDLAYWKGKLFYSNFGDLVSISIDNGEKKTLLKYDSKLGIISNPSIDNNIAYFSTNEGFVFAFDLIKNKILWNKKINERQSSIGKFNSVSIYNDILYVSFIDKIFAINAKTCDIIFSKDQKEHNVITPIAITKKEIYYTSIDGILYALDNKTGKELWNYKFANYCYTMPIISNSTIYIFGSDKNLYDGTSDSGYLFIIK